LSTEAKDPQIANAQAFSTEAKDQVTHLMKRTAKDRENIIKVRKEQVMGRDELEAGKQHLQQLEATIQNPSTVPLFEPCLKAFENATELLTSAKNTEELRETR